MAELSKRLMAIAEQIPYGASVADIGTDHAYLPIYLKSADKVRRMIACDIHRGPLLTAEKNVSQSGVSGIELRLGDGLDSIAPDEVDTVVIAGMGGEIIAGIIAGAPWVAERRTRLILQPMTSAEDLRRYLSRNGFTVLEEFAVLDSGRVYGVIVAEYDGIGGVYAGAEEYIGKMTGRNDAEKLYIKKQYRRLVKEAAEIKGIPRKRGEYEKTVRCVQGIRNLMAGLGMKLDESN